MTTEKQVVTAYVSLELSERVKRAAKFRRVTVSEYLRRILERQFKVEPVQTRRGRPPKQEPEFEQKTA